MTRLVAVISSTMLDLEGHRKEVMGACSIIGVELRMMEQLTATADWPLQESKDLVKSADIYIGIFARRYGFIPPHEPVSITELELLEAEKAGKPCLIFLSSRDHVWTEDDIETGPGAEKLQKLRQRLAERYTVKEFDSAADLRTKVVEALHIYLREHAAAGHGRPDEANLTSDELERVRYENALMLCRGHLHGLTQRKRMHDALHRLEIECFRPINTLLKRLESPGDGSLSLPAEAEYDLKVSCNTLDIVIEELQDCLDRNSDLASDSSWIAELREIRDKLQTGIKRGDFSEIPALYQEISRVLRRQPARLNSELIFEAKKLKSSDFVVQLRRETAANQATESSQGSLHQTFVALDRLVEQHDAWQNMDVELRLIEYQAVANLRDSWPFVKEQALKLYGEELTEWPAPLCCVCEALEQGAALDMRHVVTEFLKFCVLARQEFDKVDQSLKLTCGRTVEAFSCLEGEARRSGICHG